MKVFKLMFCAMVLFLINSAVFSETKYISYTYKGYSVKYPDNWKTELAEDQSLTIVSPDEESSLYIGTTAAGAGVTAKMIVDTYLTGQGLKNALSEQESVLPKEELDRMGVADGYAATFSSETEGKPMGMFLFVAVKGEIAYIIVYGTTADTKQEYQEEMYKILSSFFVQ
jgi:hypothetical protein